MQPRPQNEDFSRDPKVVEAMNADPLIALPVLILHGTLDKATKPSGSKLFYDTAGSRRSGSLLPPKSNGDVHLHLNGHAVQQRFVELPSSNVRATYPPLQGTGAAETTDEISDPTSTAAMHGRAFSAYAHTSPDSNST